MNKYLCIVALCSVTTASADEPGIVVSNGPAELRVTTTYVDSSVIARGVNPATNRSHILIVDAGGYAALSPDVMDKLDRIEALLLNLRARACPAAE